MREIKFRVWDKNNKTLFQIFDSTTQEYWFIPIWNKNFEIMQYTGLKDRKGKEIYEGDVLEFDDITGDGFDFRNKAQVEFYKGRYQLTNFLVSDTRMLEEMNESHEDFVYQLEKNCKVVGNIYENPELLTQQNGE
jgi:uncharacterized phage protein (TIGR01671 family)